MIHILIDTCIWKKLVSSYEISPNLLKLDYWISNNFLVLLCPDTLKREWEKHREIEKGKVAKALENHKKTITLLLGQDEDFIKKADEKNALDKLKSQIAIIDKLLFEKAIFIEESSDVLLLSRKNQKAGKAPFINKKDSLDDATIFFSAIKYVNSINETTLYFVSENHTDFGFQRNSKWEIHPDLLDEFPKRNVIYFTDIHQLVNSLHELGLPQINELSKSVDKIPDSFGHPTVNKNDNILDQVYYFLKERFSHFQVLPPFIWANKYPFKSTNRAYFEYSLFYLYTDNVELFELFDSLEIINYTQIEFKKKDKIAGVVNPDEKIRSVLKHLNNNLIFNISLNGERKVKQIRYFEESVMEPDSYHDNLQFDKIIESFSQSTNEDKDLPGLAYLTYEMGDYNKSAKLYLELLKKEPSKPNENLEKVLFAYNLSKLEPLVRYHYFDKPDYDLADKLKVIKGEFEANKYNFPNDKKFTSWFKNSDYLVELQSDILSDINRLRDFHFNLSRGGRGSNSFIWNIYVNHAMLISYIKGNRLIYSSYFDFNVTNEAFTEAVIMSYSIHESMYSRLETFDDWITKILILYSRPDWIIKYCNRYSVYTIKYTNNSLDNGGFIHLVRNFFNSADTLINKNEFAIGIRFTDIYRKILGNILTLSSYLTLTESQIKEISHMLVEFLNKSIPINYPLEIRYVSNFINDKGDLFDNEVLQGFLNLVFKYSKFHDERFLESLSKIINKREGKVEIRPEMFSVIKSFFEEKCPICDHSHDSSLLVDFFLIASNIDTKEKLKYLITDKLNEKFEWRLYYNASIFDVIEFNEVFFHKMKSIRKPKTDTPLFFGHYSMDEKNRDPFLGALINLSFKYKIDTSNALHHLKGYDPYYDWLIDMDEFDYTLFNPRWICEYPTTYYFQKISQMSIIKKIVRQYLETHNDVLLTTHYLNIFE